MALLQISEPGSDTAPHRRRLAVGIDLGTTHSLVAAVRSGVAEVLPDERGRVLLPSVVRYLANGEHQIGHEALIEQTRDPLNTIVSVKRLMGRGLQDIEGSTAYDLTESQGSLRLRTVQGEISPVQVSAQILAHLRNRAEAVLGDALVGAVITVPAYFDDAQRQATKDAARLAGVNVLRLLNEPTAAAVAYGLDNAAEGIYAVYDLGGGTFDVSILRLSRGVFEVVATGGDSALGGDDFDAAIVGWIVRNWNLSGLVPQDRRALLVAARDLRETLTTEEQATCGLTLSTGHSVAVMLTRERLAELIQPILQRTMDAVRRALRDAGLAKEDVQGIVLVGGTTRMPAVQAAVEQFFGRAPLTNLDPDQVVALGAARQAHLLAGNRMADDDWLLLDVIPLSLGLETMGGLVERIIERNTTIPVARAQEFTTFKDGQTAMAIHVVQGERDLVEDCRSLARFELRGIPPMVAGAARIEVTFQVDADGLLAVTAREKSSGVEASVSVKPSYGLTDDEIERMLIDSATSAGEDMRLRALREQQVEAQRLDEAIRSALRSDADLLSESEREDVESSLHKLRRAAAADDVEAIHAAIAEASRVTESFAARRMDRSIRQALTGRNLDELS